LEMKCCTLRRLRALLTERIFPAPYSIIPIKELSAFSNRFSVSSIEFISLLFIVNH
jgi:hypothetical protein